MITIRCLAPLFVLLALTACKGTGMGQMDLHSSAFGTEEEVAEEGWWDKLYGRKPMSRESGDWKAFYAAPSADNSKPDYCGFWGNCAAATNKAASSCNYYGNCTDADAKKGWW